MRVCNQHCGDLGSKQAGQGVLQSVSCQMRRKVRQCEWVSYGCQAGLGNIPLSLLQKPGASIPDAASLVHAYARSTEGPDVCTEEESRVPC